MKYLFTVIVFLVLCAVGFSQGNPLWKGYFSYNAIKDISQSQIKLFAASENAIFSKSNSTNDIKTLNTIDGLSSEIISSVYHSESANKTLIGYENGLLIVINEANGKINTVVDIIKKNIAPNIKKVNHFTEYQGNVYISCDFGIVQYNLNNLQFGDTYFIGTTVAEIKVNQTAILNGFIYAATASEGIKRAQLTNPNLIDATQWQQIVPGNFSGVAAFQNNLFTTAVSGQVSRSNNGTSFAPFGSNLTPTAVDIRASGNYLLITTSNSVFIYNQGFVLANQINNTQVTDINPTFTCATIIDNSIYLGTTESGVISALLSNPVAFEFLSPGGPTRNNIFSINAITNNLWAVYGTYNTFYTPQTRAYGFSKYNKEDGWKNFPYANVANARDLVRVTVNPNLENQIFISSYFNGLLKYENDVLVTKYDETNSGLESLVLAGAPNYKSVRIEQSAFDKQGNLWLTNGLIKNGLKVLKTNGEWQSYNMENILDDFFGTRLGKLVIDKNSTKWIGTLADGVVGFNEKDGPVFKKITEGPENGNLPSTSVQAIAIDKRNQLWIGTRAGLRILTGVDRFLGDDELKANPIIILEDGTPQELLFGQFITDIVVDGSNNKWIGTLEAGVFLVSPNGQETIHHFTSSNSPLPSNNVNDIDINPVTGEVFFATVNGMVSFKGNAIQASDNLNNVIVFPNPVRPEYTGTVKINGLLDKANVKITDIEGNLVFETISSGGSIEWDTTAFGKYRVASGVYMIFIAAQDGVETKVKKVMIIR
ncbi:MAG TPA: two-component regulator propeller domain-containing protein [Flavobacterium sp.]|jgi:ligand-binding sensor domain-containing protein